jgi:undecaprenyl-diphosphatase
VPVTREVAMPHSTSWPSGHVASAFAFATAAGAALPRTAAPLTALAALVAYSRVHTGVHYPLDVIAGVVSGVAGALVAAAAARRLHPRGLDGASALNSTATSPDWRCRTRARRCGR